MKLIGNVKLINDFVAELESLSSYDCWIIIIGH
jgi:hypothetical protein